MRKVEPLGVDVDALSERLWKGLEMDPLRDIETEERGERLDVVDVVDAMLAAEAVESVWGRDLGSPNTWAIERVLSPRFRDSIEKSLESSEIALLESSDTIFSNSTNSPSSTVCVS